jgi:hypothetical protein
MYSERNEPVSTGLIARYGSYYDYAYAFTIKPSVYLLVTLLFHYSSAGTGSVRRKNSKRRAGRPVPPPACLFVAIVLLFLTWIAAVGDRSPVAVRLVMRIMRVMRMVAVRVKMRMSVIRMVVGAMMLVRPMIRGQSQLFNHSFVLDAHRVFRRCLP